LFDIIQLLWIATGLVLLAHFVIIIVKEGPGVVMRALFKPGEAEPAAR
jgi:hypothetical protein